MGYIIPGFEGLLGKAKMRTPILLALLLTGCANLSGTRDYVPVGAPVNPDDFTPLPRARVAPLMLSQPTMRTPHTVSSILPPDPPSVPMVIQTNAAPVQQVWDTPKFRYAPGFNRSNYWGYALGSPDLRHWFTNNPTNPFDGAITPTNDWVVVRGTSGSDRFFTKMLWVPK